MIDLQAMGTAAAAGADGSPDEFCEEFDVAFEDLRDYLNSIVAAVKDAAEEYSRSPGATPEGLLEDLLGSVWASAAAAFEVGARCERAAHY